MNILKTIGITIGIIALLIVITFGSGMLDVFYKNTVGVKTESANRNIFKENKSYQEGMVNDLASYKLQLTKEKDAVVRAALIETIATKYANFDPNRIEDVSLREFLINVKNGGIK